jgi:hypothetical protein
VEGSTLQQAEEAARDREWYRRTHYKPNLPQCRTLVTVDPRAAVVSSEIEAREGP